MKTQVQEVNRNIYDIKNKDNYEIKIQGLNKEIVEEISKLKNEPEWMLEIRLKALEMYEKLELPTWGPDLSELNMEKIATYVNRVCVNAELNTDGNPVQSTGSHTHTFSISTGNQSANHVHTVTVNSSGSHTHTLPSGSTIGRANTDDEALSTRTVDLTPLSISVFVYRRTA